MASNIDGRLVAEYADGFVLSEDNADQSPYDPGRNIFHAVLHGRPVAEHGDLINLTLELPADAGDEFPGGFVIDWRSVPAGSRPIRFRKMSLTTVNGITQGAICSLVGFGWQWTDESGNHKDGVIIHPDGSTSPLADYSEID